MHRAAFCIDPCCHRSEARGRPARPHPRPRSRSPDRHTLFTSTCTTLLHMCMRMCMCMCMHMCGLRHARHEKENKKLTSYILGRSITTSVRLSWLKARGACSHAHTTHYPTLAWCPHTWHLVAVLQGPWHTHRSIPHTHLSPSVRRPPAFSTPFFISRAFLHFAHAFSLRLLELIRHVGDVHDEPVRT
jgi:hypothetical protein